MTEHKGLKVRLFKTEAAFEKWLKANLQAEGLWLRFAKKASTLTSISYEQAREVALRYGWIDGLLNTWDDDSFLRRFTPRRKRSKWSKINREIVEGLITAGRMTPSGLAEVEAAKADGRWQAAYDSSSTIEVPDDLQAALNKSKAANAYFATLTRTQRFGVLYRVHDAKRAETRTRRIKAFVAAFEAGRTGL